MLQTRRGAGPLERAMLSFRPFYPSTRGKTAMSAASQHPASPAFDRRAVLTAGTAAGLGLAGGLPPAAAAEAGRIVAEEHWAKKGPVDLYLYRKRRVGDGQEGGRPVLFLVHGSTFSSRGSYD